MDILIDKPIGNGPGEVSAAEVKSQLARANGQPITVRIHSEGGSVFDGLAMYDAFKAYAGPKRCIVESAAFSMASVVAMAFTDREITENGYVMLHSPYMENGEEPTVLESLRQRLAGIYSAGTKRPIEAIKRMMAVETFLDATEAMRAGFVTSIAAPSSRAVAALKALVRGNSKFRSAIVAKLKDDKTMTASERWKAQVDTAMFQGGLSRHKAIVAVDKTSPGLRMQMIKDANKR